MVCPVSDCNPLPESHNALFISARLTLAGGKFLNGAISVRCSDHKVYIVEVFLPEKSIDLTLFMKESFNKGIQNLGEELKMPSEKILPIAYETDFAFENEPPIAGEMTWPL